MLAAPTNVCFAGEDLDRRRRANLGRWHLTLYRRAACAACRCTAPSAGRSTRERERFVPRYYEIEQALRARIAALGPDEPLPSDADARARSSASAG